MKRKALFTFIAVLALMLIMTVPGFADEYQYTVTLDGGLYGTVNAETTAKVDYNGVYTLPDPTEVTVTDSKYYFKGWHRAGQEGILEAAPKITEDVDFVATFGITGDQVKYTVNFVDESGATLAASKEFYGNVGDKPVVAYVYVEGYQPQAYNLTTTLDADASKNVFTFTYSVETPITETTIVPGEGGTAGGGGAAAGGEGGAAAGGGAAAAAGTAGGTTGGEGAAAGGEGTNIDNGTTPSTQPADVIDLDDNDTPTTDTPDGEEGEGEDGESEEGQQADIDDNATPKGVVTGGIIAAVVAAIGAGVFAVTRRKKDDNKEVK